MKNVEIIQEIKEKNDIVAVVSEYVSLRKAGRSLLGLCPFHSEKTPSFNVNPNKQFFYCFGCGAGGDVISFLMKVENLEFIDAARRLADRAGIPWPESDLENEEYQKKETLYKVNQLTAAFYHHLLLKTENSIHARNYLEKRGITPEIWSRFNLGYAPSGWHHLTEVLRKKAASMEAAEKLGVVGFGENGYYDRFRERIIFPIFDPKGTICGFGGRVLDNSQPKYLNSPDTPLFHKSKTLYGLHLAKESIRKSGQAIIVEGYLDVIQAHQSGFTNVVASLGTALTADQAKLIKRYAAEIVLAYDSDTAGQNATIKGMEILQDNGLTVRVLSMPAGDDPDSFIKNKGASEFQNLIEKAEVLIDFKINLALKRHNLFLPEGKAAAIAEILPYLGSIESGIAREEYIRKISREIGITETAIFEELRHWYSKYKQKSRFVDRTENNSHTIEQNQKNRPFIGSVVVDQLSPLQKALFDAEKELLQSILQEYDKLERIKEELKPEELYFEIWRELYKEILTKNSVPDFVQILEEIGGNYREVAATLLAETQVKNRQVDVTGLLYRIKMLRLQELIQNLTVQISTGKKLTGELLTEADLKKCILEFTELKKKQQKEYPNFTAEI